MPEKLLEFLNIKECAMPFMLAASTHTNRLNFPRLLELVIIVASSAFASYQIIEYRLDNAAADIVTLEANLLTTNANFINLERTLTSTKLAMSDRWTGADEADYQYAHLKEHHAMMKEVTGAIEKMADRIRAVEINNGGR